jgi:hypothetical protein
MAAIFHHKEDEEAEVFVLFVLFVVNLKGQ